MAFRSSKHTGGRQQKRSRQATHSGSFPLARPPLMRMPYRMAPASTAIIFNRSLAIPGLVVVDDESPQCLQPTAELPLRARLTVDKHDRVGISLTDDVE